MPGYSSAMPNMCRATKFVIWVTKLVGRGYLNMIIIKNLVHLLLLAVRHPNLLKEDQFRREF